MCGFAGTIGAFDKGQSAQIMASVMHRRGPDGSGLWVDESGAIALAHRRLAIIDLDERSNQPMVSQDGRHVVAFNGEIYNYQEIRKKLERECRRTFRTKGDTEVILIGFQEWGVNLFPLLNGMFAFAVVEVESRRVTLCRDRLGVKPLYVRSVDGQQKFASELGALLSDGPGPWRVNVDKVSEYMWLGYVRSPATLVDGIEKLPPGTFMVVSNGTASDPKPYWDVSTSNQSALHKRSIVELADELEPLLTDAFRLRMVSDVPVGLFLSGGLDSTLLATILVKNLGVAPKAYTLAVGDAGHDESSIAKETANRLGIEHSTGNLTEQDLLESFSILAEVYDEPLADTSCIPTLNISSFVARERKVVLSADGADEIFAGYRRYIWACGLNDVRRFVPRRVLQIFAALGSRQSRYLRKLYEVLSDGSPLQGYREWNSIQSQSAATLAVGRQRGLVVDFSDNFEAELDFLRGIQYLDQVEYLPDNILLKIDRATMYHSLEGRDPFLDYRLLEFAARCPRESKIAGGKGKILLREILRRHDMTHVLLERKRGFSVPIRKWLSTNWAPIVEQYMSSENIGRYSWINPQYVNDLRSAFQRRDPSVASPIYALLVLLRWCDRWNVS